jgi:hypothetical protein
MKLLSANQTKIVENFAATKQTENTWVPVTRPNSYATMAAAKKIRTDAVVSATGMVTLPGRLAAPERPPPKRQSDDPPEVAKFKETVREAEKSTLIFNLDMGRVPLLNAETIAKKATLTLRAMAAKVEKSKTSLPSKEKIVAIDDVLSVTTGHRFYGSVTKTYNNPKDAASGSFCTVPVRYDFKDQKTKIQAETILRTTCNVNCATPYPTILRECIKQTGDFFRGVYNTNYVAVSVDVGKLSLKVSHKQDKDSKWIPHDKLIPIPPAAFNVSARKPPLGFRMTGLIPSNESEPMETAGAGSSQNSEAGSGSTRTSRKDSANKSPSPKKW